VAEEKWSLTRGGRNRRFDCIKRHCCFDVGSAYFSMLPENRRKTNALYEFIIC